MLARDIPALDAILDDGFVLVHMTGMRQDKRAFLQSIADGTLSYFSCADDRIEVRVDGDTCRLTGQSRVSAAVFGGGRHAWRLQQDLSLRKREGRWRIACSRASTY